MLMNGGTAADFEFSSKLDFHYTLNLGTIMIEFLSFQ